jgi:hypothetical protein
MEAIVPVSPTTIQPIVSASLTQYTPPKTSSLCTNVPITAVNGTYIRDSVVKRLTQERAAVSARERYRGALPTLFKSPVSRAKSPIAQLPIAYTAATSTSGTSIAGPLHDPRSPRPERAPSALTVRFGGDQPGMHWMTGSLAAASFAPNIKLESMESLGVQLKPGNSKENVRPIMRRAAASLEKMLDEVVLGSKND